LIVVFVAFIGILAAVAIPAYQGYTIKARISQAVKAGRSATDYVDNYYNQYRSIPRSLEAAYFVVPLPAAVKEAGVDSQTGTITITLNSAAVIGGKTLKFVPARDASDHLGWTCMSEEIQDRYLPQECRQSR
jgi:type IV pilus assembly protein PilA